MSVGWKRIITTDDIYDFIGDSTTTISISPPTVNIFEGVFNCNNGSTGDMNNYCLVSHFPTNDGWQNVTCTKKNSTLTHFTPRFCTAMLEQGMLNPYKDLNWKISSVAWNMWVPFISNNILDFYAFTQCDWFLDFLYIDIGSGTHIPEDVQMQDDMNSYYTNQADDVTMSYLLQDPSIASTNDETYLEENAIKIYDQSNVLMDDDNGDNVPDNLDTDGEGVLYSGTANNFHPSNISFNHTTLVIPQIFKRWSTNVTNNDSSFNKLMNGSVQLKLQITLKPSA